MEIGRTKITIIISLRTEGFTRMDGSLPSGKKIGFLIWEKMIENLRKTY
jgi:hypothetical protein